MRVHRTIREHLRGLTLFRLAYELIGAIVFDLKGARYLTVIAVSLGNMFPDLIIFSKLRALLWYIAGAKIEHVSTCTIRKGAFIEYAYNLSAGKNFHVGRNTYFCAHAPIKCGDDVTISLNCMILTMHHTGEKHEIEHFAGVEIGTGAIVYAGAIVLPGSVIVPGSIVPAGLVYPKGNR